jgi:hypothetical protein
MLETLEAWISFIVVLIFSGTILGLFLMWYGAGLAGIQKSSFWRSLAAAFLSSADTYLMALVALLAGPPVKLLYGLAAGLLLSVFIIKGVYRTSFLKALVPWLFFLIAQTLVILAATELFIGGFDDLFRMIRQP